MFFKLCQLFAQYREVSFLQNQLCQSHQIMLCFQVRDDFYWVVNKNNAQLPPLLLLADMYNMWMELFSVFNFFNFFQLFRLFPTFRNCNANIRNELGKARLNVFGSRAPLNNCAQHADRLPVSLESIDLEKRAFSTFSRSQTSESWKSWKKLKKLKRLKKVEGVLYSKLDWKPRQIPNTSFNGIQKITVSENPGVSTFFLLSCRKSIV